jgi:predicted translin family RNA/ssDNA-binding protein
MYEKAKGEMRLTERIVAALPGFRGYKEKELRRESDRLIRNHIFQRLTTARKDLKEAFQKLSDSKMQEVLTDMDRFIMRFDRVAQKINHASYGYAGFFNIVKVEEDKLDKMIEFDNGLLDHAEKLVAEADAFKKEVAKQNFEKTRGHLDNLESTLEELEETFDGRDEVVKGVR